MWREFFTIRDYGLRLVDSYCDDVYGSQVRSRTFGAGSQGVDLWNGLM